MLRGKALVGTATAWAKAVQQQRLCAHKVAGAAAAGGVGAVHKLAPPAVTGGGGAVEKHAAAAAAGDWQRAG